MYQLRDIGGGDSTWRQWECVGQVRCQIVRALSLRERPSFSAGYWGAHCQRVKGGCHSGPRGRTASAHVESAVCMGSTHTRNGCMHRSWDAVYGSSNAFLRALSSFYTSILNCANHCAGNDCIFLNATISCFAPSHLCQAFTSRV
ncbi:hypothetical protein FIBSPDRAFT_64942 [Athelia psychrophila]|uniref:Uncharacterized protein n=1 Tax=Athelia psychrophila TaxID=1759441 RepID=A0A166EW12_9AGAM|nr:hypothetical protein FIBSPDRAFT_64942 [Fibularhizoctonia sp. CBS 109695]